MKKTKFLLPLLIILALGCSSPSDIDAPRKKIKLGGDTTRIQTTVREISIEENGSEKKYIATTSYLAVDTIKNPPAAWFYIKIEPSVMPKTEKERIQLTAIELKADSVNIDGTPFQFINFLNNKSFAKFGISRGLNCVSDTSMYSGQDKSLCELSITLDRTNKKIWSQIYSKLYNQKVWLESRDTIVKDTVIEIRYDTVWVDNKPVVKTHKEKVIKEMKLNISREMRSKDSLFIRGKFNFDY